MHHLLSYGAIALVVFGYFTRQNATYMAYMLPAFYLCVFPSNKWAPPHPLLQALPFIPAEGHKLADAVALLAAVAVVVKMFKPCAFLAWALVLTHFLPCKCGFVVPSSSHILSSTLHSLHFVAFIDLPVIMLCIFASASSSILTRTTMKQVWPLLKGCFVRNFVPCLCIAFLPSASPLLKATINGLGGACKFAVLGKYTFHAFSRGFVDVFLWGILCYTLPTWQSGAFTGYPTLLAYLAAAVVIEVRKQTEQLAAAV